VGTPQVTTLHGQLGLPDLEPLYREYSDMPLVSISDAQREPLPWAHWVATVHHGLPAGQLRFRPGRNLIMGDAEVKGEPPAGYGGLRP
jgi:hypothetical protein